MRTPLLSPVWLVGHALVVAVLLSFPLLGLWQLDRHEQRQAADAALEQRPEEPPLEAGELHGDPEALAYRRVAVTGTWEPDGEVLVSTRPHRGRPGHHVLTPLRLDDGSAVLVNRGWVPHETDAVPVDDAAPPEGDVEVTGLALPGERARRAGVLGGEGRDAGDVAAGEPIDFVSHADPGVVGRTLDEDLPAVVIRADEGHRIAGAGSPVTVPPPEPQADVDHFSYAMQWFLFTGVVAVGYPVLLHRRHREGRSPGGEDGGGSGAADGRGAGGGTGAEPGAPGADDPARVP